MTGATGDTYIGVTKGVRDVQRSRAEVRTLLSVDATEGRILYKWREIFGRQNDYKLSWNVLKLGTRRALGLRATRFCKTLHQDSGARVPLHNPYKKGIAHEPVKVESGYSDRSSPVLSAPRITLISSISLVFHRQLSTCDLPESQK